MKRGYLISIYGLDGAGKTTQVNLLAKELRKLGFKTKIVWIKSSHTLAFLLIKLFEKLTPKLVE